jgi:hypothetical protein
MALAGSIHRANLNPREPANFRAGYWFNAANLAFIWSISACWPDLCRPVGQGLI